MTQQLQIISEISRALIEYILSPFFHVPIDSFIEQKCEGIDLNYFIASIDQNRSLCLIENEHNTLVILWSASELSDFPLFLFPLISSIILCFITITTQYVTAT